VDGVRKAIAVGYGLLDVFEFGNMKLRTMTEAIIQEDICRVRKHVPGTQTSIVRLRTLDSE